MQFESFGVMVAKIMMNDKPVELLIPRLDFLEYFENVKTEDRPTVVRFMDKTGRFVRANVAETAAYCEEIFPTDFGNMHVFYKTRGGTANPDFLIMHFRDENYSLVVYPLKG